MTEKTKSNRIWALDFLKVFAILGVIMAHLVYDDLGTALKVWMDGGVEVSIFLTVSGYTYALSLEKRKIDTPLLYLQKHLPRYLASVLGPFAVTFLAEVFYHSFWITWQKDAWLWMEMLEGDEYKGYFRVREMLETLPQGGLGPGAYYIPLLVVLAFLVPVLYYPLRRWPLPTVAVCVVGIFCWQAGALPGELLNTWVYRMTFVVAGMLLFRYRQKIPLWLPLPILALGIADHGGWLHGVPLGYQIYVLGIVMAALCWLRPVGALRVALRPVEWVGSASLFIYLAQKFYCSTCIPRWLAELHQVRSGWAHLGICMLLGIAFWQAYTRLAGLLRGWLKSRGRERREVLS